MHRFARLGRRVSAPVVTVTGGGVLVWSCSGTRNEEESYGFDVTSVVRTVVQPLLLPAVSIGSILSTALTTTVSTTICEDDSDFSEPSRYERCLVYHRGMLDEYRSRWQWNSPTSRTPTTTGWPSQVPSSETEVSVLEYDYKFATGTYRDDMQFRLAAYYLQTGDEHLILKRAFPLLQDLALRGHLDAMCLLGTVWMEGRSKAIGADPPKACLWLRRAADLGHRQANYEMGVALYTGEGVPENESLAAEYFERAASMGHPAAAYMLGDCLLDGVGVLRDRAEALEWLVAAGEMGHRGARSRVLAVLEKGHGDNHGKFTDGSRQTFRRRQSMKDQKDEEQKWTEEQLQRLVTLERQFTIGGGTRNPVVLAKRRTIVAESREEEEGRQQPPAAEPRA